MAARHARRFAPVDHRLIVLAAALAASLAACATTSPRPSPSGTLRSIPTPAVPSLLPTPTASATASAQPTPTPAAPAVTAGELVCAGSQLQIAYWPALSGAATGNLLLSLAVWNSGARPCKLRGWATLQFLNPTGGLVSTHWIETTALFFGSAALAAVSLLPCADPTDCASGAPAAYIAFAGDDVIPPCEIAAGVRVLMPGASTPVIANLRANGFPDGQTLCSAGKIFVLPILSPQAAIGHI